MGRAGRFGAGSVVITVVARWDSSQMEPELEWRMWRQLRGAFDIHSFIFTPVVDEMSNIDIRQAPSMHEALAVLSPDTQHVFLEPTGYKTVNDIPREGDIAIIVGSSTRDNVQYAEIEEMYSIVTAGDDRHNHLYGINAAAIALAYHWGQ
jgi:hypothetical protein